MRYYEMIIGLQIHQKLYETKGELITYLHTSIIWKLCEFYKESACRCYICKSSDNGIKARYAAHNT